MSNDKSREYYLPCVTCPFCKEIVEAKVTENKDLKKIFCPACKVTKEYKINN